MAETGSEKLMHLAKLNFEYMLRNEGVCNATPAGELVHGCLSMRRER